MASVETIIRRGRVVHLGIPWDAAARRKGPSKVLDHQRDAQSYAEGWERDRDRVAEAFGVAPVRNRKRVLFSDYATQYARRKPGRTRRRPGWIAPGWSAGGSRSFTSTRSTAH